nr:hypothetical protein [Tanacetum cinerariifolium]
LHYALEHPSTLICYPRFAKLLGTHRTISAPRSPNPKTDEAKSSALRKFTKSQDELEAKQSVQKVKEYLIAKEIEKLESLEVEITAAKQPVNVIKEEEESAEDDYELRRKEKGKHPKMVDERVKELTKKQFPLYVTEGLIMEREKSQVDVVKIIADAIQQERKNLRSKISSQINDASTNYIPSHVDSSVKNYMSGHILHVNPSQATPTFVQEQQQQLYLTMRDNPRLQQDYLPIWLALKYNFQILYVATTPCRPSAVCPRDQDDCHDDAYLEGENDTKRQKTSEHGTYVSGESSSGQDNESEPGPSTLRNQEQSDDFDFWTDSYAIDGDELHIKKVPQELVDGMS